jgi:lantibiotic leader peptide-processing serine protease
VLFVVVVLAFATGQTAPAQAGTMQTYLVLYSAQAVPADASTTIASAGGTLVYRYDQIGVAIARSDGDSFRANLLKDKRIEGAAATTNFATQLSDDVAAANDSAAPVANNTPAPGSDTLSGRQWDMDQIHAPEARAITGGSSNVLVGDIDTGLDYTHPDLAANVDDAASVNCVSECLYRGR